MTNFLLVAVICYVRFNASLLHAFDLVLQINVVIDQHAGDDGENRAESAQFILNQQGDLACQTCHLYVYPASLHVVGPLLQGLILPGSDRFPKLLGQDVHSVQELVFCLLAVQKVGELPAKSVIAVTELVDFPLHVAAPIQEADELFLG